MTRRFLFSVVVPVVFGLVFANLALFDFALDSRIRKQEAHLTILAWPQHQIELIETSTVPANVGKLEISGPMDDKGFIQCGGELKLRILSDCDEGFTFNKDNEKWLFEILEKRARCK